MQTVEKKIRAKIPGDETGISIRKSVCTICDPTTQCGLDVYVRDGVVVKVEGSEQNPFNRGALCAKGAATRQYLYNEKRIKTPLRRCGPRGSGKFEAISWDEALSAIADKCIALKKEFGPESVVFYAGYTKYFRPFLQRLAHSFGSPNYCSESSTCNMATTMAQKLVFGEPGTPDLANTDCLLVWSSNPYYTGHGRAQVIEAGRRAGMKMIVIDPRVTPTAERADIHLQLRPGTDGALALTMANVIIAENLYDAEFVAQYTRGFDDYRDYVRGYTPELGEEITGVPAAKICAAARMLATAQCACLLPSASPVVHHTNGVQNYRAAFMLIALTGNYDVKGGNIAEPTSYLYMAGRFVSRETEFENPVPLSEMAPRIGADKFPVWMEVASPEAQSVCLPRQIINEQPYPIKAVLGFGMNYRMWPDSEGMASSLDKLDFFSAADIFMTDTCRHADIVLPACTSLERSELRAYGGGYVLFTEPAIAPLFDSRADIDIIIDIGKRICPNDAMFARGYEYCMNWILEPSGLTVAQMRSHPGGMKIPSPLHIPERKYRNGAQTPSGKIEFKSSVLEKYNTPGLEALPVYTPPKHSREKSPEMAAHYPFILNTGSRLPMFIHSRLNHLSWTNALRPQHPAADIHPDTAKSLGLGKEDQARLSTPFGSIVVNINPTWMVLPDVVHMYHGCAKADVNKLFEWDYVDPISGFPGYKSSLCKLEKIVPSEEV